MPQPRIFVSYNRKDRDITQRLVADLHKAGAEVWVDVDGIQSGNFMQAIDQALMKCDWMVLVLSPGALESNYVSQETYTALHRVQQGFMKAVIPMLVAQCAPGSIPPQWDVLHRYDATQDYDTALAGVLHAIGLSPLASVPAIPAERFPARLARLGFEGRVINGVEVIIPPVCSVPAGEFLMGTNGSPSRVSDRDEQPQHRLTLPAFQIGRFPVTVAEYACFVSAGHPEPEANIYLYDDDDGEDGRNVVVDWKTQLTRLDHPVVCVTWYEARDYTKWLEYVTGEPWRLPTEAEWEKAASLDTATNQARIYPWGDNFEPGRCNYWGGGKNSTTPVGAYPAGASLYGALDMAGNVWEWTSSAFQSYPYQSDDGREDINLPDEKVERGGSWHDEEMWFCSTLRVADVPEEFGNSLGFRLVRAGGNM